MGEGRGGGRLGLCYLPVGVGIHARVVYFAAGFDEAGEEGCEGEEDDDGFHCWVGFGFGFWFRLFGNCLTCLACGAIRNVLRGVGVYT